MVKAPLSKPETRRLLKQAVVGVETARRHALSLAAAEQVIATPEWRRAQVIMLYLALPSEVETSPLAYRAWQAGKTVVVPKITSYEQRRMIPVQINSLAEDELHRTEYGTREPAAIKPVPVRDVDFCLVPGLGFSRRGERIGRGLGFYDRFLSQEEFLGVACGLAFDVQVLDALPADELDEPVDLLATESQLMRFRGGVVEGS